MRLELLVPQLKANVFARHVAFHTVKMQLYLYEPANIHPNSLQ